MRVGVDTGGTFTDFVAIRSDGCIVLTKTSTTPRDLTQGILKCFDKVGLNELSDVDQVLHGATVAINTIIQRVGARTALITTRGIRDVLEVGRGNRPEPYNLFFHREAPLVPRRWRLEVSERISSRGEVLQALDEEELAAIVARLKEAQVEAVAVCFLHSYVNPTHEQRCGEVLRQELPQAYITLSHELMRQMREYERTSTTVLNAYVGPVVAHYLDELDKKLRARSFSGSLLIMESNGGCMSTEVAKLQPIATAESGPVSGIIGACELSRLVDAPAVVAFDMGGTTAKAAFISGGKLPLAPGYHIGGYGIGFPMMLPVADVVEVGSGGGSIAWLDNVGALSVGPRSAGAEPGPVCYGLGGTEPTVTDANLLLGRLNSTNFLGGEMLLEKEKAAQAMGQLVAERLDMTVEKAADAVVQIVTANMALAVRRVSVERGIDPRDCVMIAFGGAGPLHAVGVARNLSIPRVIVPRMPGHFAALGMLVAELRHEYVQTYLKDFRTADLSEIVAYLQAFEHQAWATLTAEGANPQTINCPCRLDLRYRGQDHVLSVPATIAELKDGDRAGVLNRYHSAHEEAYGYAAPSEVVEVVNLRMTALAKSMGGDTSVFLPLPTADIVPEITRRPVYLGVAWGWQETTVCQRGQLGPGFRIEGPAIVEEQASTTLLFPGDRLSVDRFGNLIVEVA